jgi:hypothetical protein
MPLRATAQLRITQGRLPDGRFLSEPRLGAGAPCALCGYPIPTGEPCIGIAWWAPPGGARRGELHASCRALLDDLNGASSPGAGAAR